MISDRILKHFLVMLKELQSLLLSLLVISLIGLIFWRLLEMGTLRAVLLDVPITLAFPTLIVGCSLLGFLLIFFN